MNGPSNGRYLTVNKKLQLPKSRNERGAAIIHLEAMKSDMAAGIYAAYPITLKHAKQGSDSILNQPRVARTPRAWLGRGWLAIMIGYKH